jgi:hypothetical protein
VALDQGRTTRERKPSSRPVSWKDGHYLGRTGEI